VRPKLKPALLVSPDRTEVRPKAVNPRNSISACAPECTDGDLVPARPAEAERKVVRRKSASQRTAGAFCVVRPLREQARGQTGPVLSVSSEISTLAAFVPDPTRVAPT